MNYKFTSRRLTLDNLERSNEGHWVFIGLLCIMDNIVLESGAVRPRGLLLICLLKLSFEQNYILYVCSSLTPCDGRLPFLQYHKTKCKICITKCSLKIWIWYNHRRKVQIRLIWR